MDPTSVDGRNQRVPLWVLVGTALLLGVGLVWFEQHAPGSPTAVGGSGVFPGSAGETSGSADSPLGSGVGLFKLIAAALIGAVVSSIHRRLPGDKPIPRSLAQAQILLCVAGALMMVIIGTSFARALGVAGGATIIRFRTNVEDPKDSTVLFLLLGLGMACGIGEFGVAGLGTAFLCLCLVLLERIVDRKPRSMFLEMEAVGPQFPAEYVNRILAAYQVRFEPREVHQHDKKARARYHCTLDPDTPLQRLSDQLTDTDADGLRSVAWETSKRE